MNTRREESTVPTAKTRKNPAMTRNILRRLIAMPFLVLGIVTLAFRLIRVTKGGLRTAIMSDRQMNNPEVVVAAKAKWGLDRSLPERLGSYIGDLQTGDRGKSFSTRRPVAQDVLFRPPQWNWSLRR